ncbi:hypothetical protein [Paenibacillus sp. MBLB4367]|uniref:hypothetical protein n=1 Tax=Paenibacillus sp. MBLB4367 TaxID=3384767 RepID=UPI0039083523
METIEKGILERMIHGLLWTALLTAPVMFLAACEKSSNGQIAQSAAPASPSMPEISNTPQYPSPSASSPVVERGISASLTELSICQMDKPLQGTEFVGASSCIVSYGTERLITPAMPMPVQPEKYSLYMEEVYFFVRFGTNDEKTLARLTGQIAAAGGAMKLEKEGTQLDSSNIRYKGVITGIKEEVVLTFGDMPPITLKRSGSRLVYEADPARSASKEALLLAGNENGAQLLLPAGETEATFVFSEPVRTDKAKITASGNDPEKKALVGTWLDDRRLTVPIPAGAASVQLNMENVFAVSGNYFGEPWGGTVYVRKVPDREWRSFPSGETAYESAYAKYYDFLLFSPDKSRTLGLVEVGGPIADEGGRYYALVLEREGQPPLVVRSPIHFPEALVNMPVRWLDNDRISYVDYEGWKLFRVSANQTGILAASDELKGSFGSMAYDEREGSLILLTHRFDEKEQIAAVDRRTLDANGKISLARDFASTIRMSHYSILRLPVIPVSDGVFWTKTKGGKAVTEFVARNGRTYETEGVPVTTDGKRAFVSVQPTYQDETKWFEWTPGKEKVPLLKAPGPVVPFGAMLIAETDVENGLRKAYDPDKRQWADFPQSRVTDLYPVQTIQGIYRENAK